MISTHDVFGKPRVYKNREMFPIQLRDADEFYASVQCLLIPKNVTNDVRLLQMSYLKYLAVVALQEESIMEMLMKLTKLIFKWESFDVYFSNDKDGKIDLDGVVTIMLDEGIEGREMRIHERDFDKIKTIICEQNLVDLDDKYVNPEVQAKIDESRKFLSKENNYCYCTNSNISELLNISITQVSKLVNSLKKKGYIDIEIKYKESSKVLY